MKNLCLLLIASMLAIGHSTAHGVVLLPDPDDPVDGFDVASPDATATTNPYGLAGGFVVYSTDLLQQLQALYPAELPVGTLGDYGAERGGAGVGGQDLIIYTQAGGQNNGVNLDTPLDSATGATPAFSGLWGNGTHATTNGATVLVSEVIAFLPTALKIPVFAFDNVQLGGTDVNISGYVEIYDPTTASVLKQWSFGTAIQPASLTISNSSPPPATLTGSHNVGSGVIDFWAYDPTMNLTPYSDSDNIFRVFASLSGLDGGGEELFIAGNVAPQSTRITAIPEPGSIAIFSLMGLVGGLRAIRRRTL